MSSPTNMQAGVPQDPVLFPTQYNLYINYTPETIRVNLGFFADDACLYATERREGCLLGKLQRDLSLMEA
jgi:hypothetical protein